MYETAALIGTMSARVACLGRSVLKKNDLFGFGCLSGQPGKVAESHCTVRGGRASPQLPEFAG